MVRPSGGVVQRPLDPRDLRGSERGEIKRLGQGLSGLPAEDAHVSPEECLGSKAEDVLQRIAEVADAQVGTDDHHDVRGVLHERAIVALGGVKLGGALLHAPLEVAPQRIVLEADSQLQDSSQQHDDRHDHKQRAGRSPQTSSEPPADEHGADPEDDRERRDCQQPPPVQSPASPGGLCGGSQRSEDDQQKPRDPAGVEGGRPLEVGGGRAHIPIRGVRDCQAGDSQGQQTETVGRIVPSPEGDEQHSRDGEHVEQRIGQIDHLGESRAGGARAHRADDQAPAEQQHAGGDEQSLDRRPEVREVPGRRSHHRQQANQDEHRRKQKGDVEQRDFRRDTTQADHDHTPTNLTEGPSAETRRDQRPRDPRARRDAYHRVARRALTFRPDRAGECRHSCDECFGDVLKGRPEWAIARVQGCEQPVDADTGSAQQGERKRT